MVMPLFTSLEQDQVENRVEVEGEVEGDCGRCRLEDWVERERASKTDSALSFPS